MKLFLILLGIILGVLLLGLLAVLYFLQFAIGRNPLVLGKKKEFCTGFEERIRREMAWIQTKEMEHIVRESFDGLKISAELLPAEKEAKGLLVLIHGFRGSAVHDFSCAARFYHELGYHLLLVNQRSHGSSEGRFITFGIKERFDCKMWTEYAAERFGKNFPIFLDGISMGGATVLMASGLELPGNVKGIIADCGFTSPWDILESVMQSWLGLKPFPLLPIMEMAIRLVGGFGLREYSTLEALKTNRIPVLFVHGKADDFVPCHMTVVNYEACRAPKELFLAEGAGHGTSFLVQEALCRKTLIAFLDKYNP